MSKLDKIKYVLQSNEGPISIKDLTEITNFDKDLVEFMIDELESIGKVEVDSTGNVLWTSKRH